MAVSKAQQRAVSKYMKENYDVYQIRMPKGKKGVIQACAEKQGLSLNAYINAAVDDRMERDNAADGAAVRPTGAEEQAGENYVLSEKLAERP